MRGLARSPKSGAHQAAKETPTDAAPLIGRELDLAALLARLDAEPLVTVVGSGGVGKTCLAQAALQARRNSFPAGACFVTLDAVTEPATLLRGVAATLGVRVAQGEDRRRGRCMRWPPGPAGGAGRRRARGHLRRCHRPRLRRRAVGAPRRGARWSPCSMPWPGRRPRPGCAC